jgi:hypothetical protein
MAETLARSRGKSPTKQRKKVFKLMRRDDLTVIQQGTHGGKLQRTPRDTRVRGMRGEHYMESKEGELKVAHITDGPHKGANHIIDGGTRWLAKEDEPDYEFYCVIEEMTEREAAEATHVFNNEQRRHTAYQGHLIGIAAEFPLDLAMEDAFSRVGVTPDERSSTRDRIAAIKASERILLDAYKANDGQWEPAIARLVDVLTLAREAYLDHTAHDADFIQALAVLWALNKDGHSLAQPRVRDRLVKTLRRRPDGVADYRFMAQQAHRTGSFGGSESRGTAMARFIARDHNGARLTPDSPLWIEWPRSRYE